MRLLHCVAESMFSMNVIREACGGAKLLIKVWNYSIDQDCAKPIVTANANNIQKEPTHALLLIRTSKKRPIRP